MEYVARLEFCLIRDIYDCLRFLGLCPPKFEADRERETPLTPFTPQKYYIPRDCIFVASSKRLRNDSGGNSRTMENSALSEVDEGGRFEHVSSRSKTLCREIHIRPASNVIVPASRTVLFSPTIYAKW